MPITLSLTTTVLPGNRIEISAPELPVGRAASVIVTVDEPMPKRRFRDIVDGYQGGGLFRTAAEVDAFLNAERDSWDN